MQLQLIRHATMLIEYADMRLLLDPMLSDAGAMPPIENSPQPRPNPLVPLPCPANNGSGGKPAIAKLHAVAAVAEIQPKRDALLIQLPEAERSGP